MYIEKIQSPVDLKGLDLKALQVVADETRRAVLNRVSKHGGHVDLTLALWKLPWRCIMCSTRRKISWCSM